METGPTVAETPREVSWNVMKCHAAPCAAPLSARFRRGFVVPIPACLCSTASRSPPSVRAAAGRTVRRDPVSRVSRACLRLRARGRFRAHLSRPFRRGRFAPMPGKAASGYRSLPPYICHGQPDVKIKNRTFLNFFAPNPPFTAARLPGPATAVILARRSRPSAIMDNARLNNDAPITEPGQDRLGFGELARHLADVFLRNDLSGGLVVGIEGEWGSGKSSLANLALDMLGKSDNAPSIVRFSPWIVGNRSELLRELFLEFDKVLYNSFPAAGRRSARTLLRRYANSASALAAAGDIAAAAGLPVAGVVSQALKHSASAASNAAAPSLATLNQGLRRHFQSLPRPVVVFIDDIDRLEPHEAVEVLRLVRAVADFPNVGYLLAYDPDNLAKCLENAIRVDNGYAYIEKLVQASFAIPEPMGFDLRSWLTEETKAIFDGADLAPETNERLDRALSCWCAEYILTPRDVVRTANALKLHIAPLADRLDPADGLFVQTIRLHRPELHEWIQRYLMKKFGSDPNDTHLARKDAIESVDGKQESELEKIIDKKGNAQLQFLNELRQHLPQASIPNSETQSAFGAGERQQFVVERRLCSASHFRLYFALSLPAGFLGDEEVSAFLDMCSQDRDAAVRHFRHRCTEDRPQGGNMAEVLLSGILQRTRGISADKIPDLLTVVGDSMDDFARRLPEQPGNPPLLYGDALEVVRLVERLDTGERLPVLKELFANAESLAWLNAIVGDAIIEHGFAGFQEAPVEQRLLNEKEFECIRLSFLERLERVDAADLKGTPFFLSLMYVWHWAGNGERATDWVRRQSRSDADFISLLCQMKSKSRIHDGNGVVANYYLARQTLVMFFGSVDAVETRLDPMRYNVALSEEQRTKAKRLFSSIERESQA